MTTFLRLKNTMRFLLLCMAFWGMQTDVTAQTTLGRQNFEVTPATPTMTFATVNTGSVGSETGYSTGTSGSSNVAPTNANLFSEGTRGYRFNPTGSNVASQSLTFSSVNTTGYGSITLSLRVAAMSLGTTGNGMDTNANTDEILIEVSPDNGTTWYQQAKVNVTGSGGNTRWAFTGTGSGSRAYAANNTFSNFSVTASSNPATVTGAAAITTATITNLPAVANLRIRVTMQSNAVTEAWIIDDLILTGIVSNAAPTATAVDFSGTLTAGQTLTSSYTYNDAEGDATGTPTYRWFRANDAAGAGQAVIGGATASTYMLTNDDAGKFIRVGVTPTATAGTSPGTEAVSAYKGAVEASGNSLSTITVTPGFVPTTNVNYALYTGTNVTGSSFEIAKFNVNDIVGVPTNDGFPTILNNLTFSLSNFANIEKVAIYNDSNVEIQELTAAATLNFTGLNISAASGSSATFSVRVTFKTTVTDNVQPQLTITSATAAGETSFFAAANAGGASSSVSGDDNRIEVTATTLFYVQQPTNSILAINMTPAVTVRAVDGNNMLDLDFTGIVSITSFAPLTTAQNQPAVNGIATFSTISFSATGTGYTLGANSTGLAGATSTTFDVSVQAAGELLFEENFDFTGLLTANGYSLTGSTASPALSAGAAGLTYANYGSTGIGNSLAMATSGQDLNRSFTPQTVNSTTYLSFLVNVSAAQTGDYFIHLSSSTAANEFRGRVYARINSGNLQFGVSSTGGSIVYSASNYALNTTYLVVLKHHYTGTTVTSSIYVNPSLYSEPATADATQSTDAATTNVGLVGIRQGGASSSTTLRLDGIRAATNWGAALGNPQYDADATINAGNYNSVTVFSGTLTPSGSLTVNNEIHVSNGADLTFPMNINLIQKGAANNNTGKITVKRDVSMKRLDYVYWSSPVAGQDLKLFTPYTVSQTNAPGFPTPTGTSRFYTLNETTNAFQAIAEPLGTPFEAGHGYMLRAPNNFPVNLTPAIFAGSFNGTPNNGDINVSVTNNGSGMNMIGNPYPSTLDTSDFLLANGTLETLYFWSHEGANYATYNATGQTSPGSGAITPNESIQVGQGFIAKTSAAATVHFTNALRVNNTQGQFFRGVANEKNRIWLNFSNQTTPLNQILTGYVTDATNDLDPKFDGKLFDATGSKLYNLVDNNPYVIQGRALPFSPSDVVALGFKAATAGNYTIALDHVDGLFTQGQDIFIKDNLTGVTHNLNDGGYTFASEAGTFDERFTMVYQTTLGVTNPSIDGNSVVVFTKDNVLNINSGNTEMQNVKIFDIRGRLLFEQKDINATTVSISNLKAAKQVLVVQVTADNKTISKKVVY